MRGLQNVPWREASLVTAAIRCRWRDRERNADAAWEVGAGRERHLHLVRQTLPPPWQHQPVPRAAQHSVRDGSVLQTSAAGSLVGAAPRERGRFEQASGLVMLSADSLGGRAEEKAQIPVLLFNQKKKKEKNNSRVFSMFSLLE